MKVLHRFDDLDYPDDPLVLDVSQEALEPNRLEQQELSSDPLVVNHGQWRAEGQSCDDGDFVDVHNDYSQHRDWPPGRAGHGRW